MIDTVQSVRSGDIVVSLLLTQDRIAMDWDACFAERVQRMGASEIRELLKLLDRPQIISFAGGIPDPALFPVEVFAEAYQGVLGDTCLSGRALQYSVTEGYGPLRSWLAAHMAQLGVPCHEDNILVTSGSQQGLDLLGRVFLSDRSVALVTEPTYLGALQAFNVYKPRYVALVPEELADGVVPRAVPGARGGLAYVVADFANPTGERLSEAARTALLELCEARDIPLIEDAAYEAIRFGGQRVPACLTLDVRRKGSIDAACTLYCGTFSKVLSPGLRVGWICGPRDAIRRITLAKQAADLHVATINQMVMLRVAEQVYESQAARISTVYARRCRALLTAIDAHMPAGVSSTRPEGGMFTWVTMPPQVDADDLLVEALREQAIAFVPGRPFSATGGQKNSLRLNFSLHAEDQLNEGIARLAGLIARTHAKPAQRPA